MFFHQRFVPGLAIASYLVGDEKARQVAVIDPTRDVDDYIQIAKDEGLHITHILETHVHADYVSGSAELKARLNGHGGLLKDRFQEVPKDRPIAAVCGTGYRGSIAASFLKSHGYEKVSNVLGGMTAWKSAGLPLAR